MGEMKPVPVWKKPKQFEQPPRATEGSREDRKKEDKEERKKAFHVVEGKWRQVLDEAGQDLDAYYAALDGFACDYHRVRSGLDMGDPRQHGRVE